MQNKVRIISAITHHRPKNGSCIVCEIFMKNMLLATTCNSMSPNDQTTVIHLSYFQPVWIWCCYCFLVLLLFSFFFYFPDITVEAQYRLWMLLLCRFSALLFIILLRLLQNCIHFLNVCSFRCVDFLVFLIFASNTIHFLALALDVIVIMAVCVQVQYWSQTTSMAVIHVKSIPSISRSTKTNFNWVFFYFF